MKRRSRRREHPAIGAFTLVELLVATTMTAVIVTGVYTALGAGMEAWRRRQAEVEAGAGLRRVLMCLRDDLEGAVSCPLPVKEGEEAREARPSFVGTGSEMTFVTTNGLAASTLRPPASWAHVRYGVAVPDPLDTDQDTSPRVVREWTFLSGRKPITDTRTEPLLVPVKSVEFRYLVRSRRTDRYGWASSFRSGGGGDRLPRAVRVTVTTACRWGGAGRERDLALRTTVSLGVRVSATGGQP